MKRIGVVSFVCWTLLWVLSSCSSYGRYGRGLVQPRGYFVEERGFMQQSYPAPIAPIPPMNYEETHYYYPVGRGGAPAPMSISPPNCGGGYASPPSPYPLYYH